MRLLFLQHVYDVMGGSFMVNCALARRFLQEGHEVIFLSLRSGGRQDMVPYPSQAKQVIIHKDALWETPLLSEAVHAFKKGHVARALKQWKKRRAYDVELAKDYERSKQEIENLAPDFIICSHYECLDGVPQAYLKRTINHYHTTFAQVLAHRTQLPFFKKYNDQVGRLLWLSKATCEQAKEHGLSNSSYIYNPINFESEESSDGLSRHALFIGRFSKEKRVDLLVKLFDETLREYKISNWELDLVGLGELQPETKVLMEANGHVHYLGATSDPKRIYQQSSLLLLTSSFEGLALVILEANECGVPCLAFDFGEAAQEEILNGVTGTLVAQDDFEAYKKALAELMIDEEKCLAYAKASKAFAQQFHIDVIISKWYALFEELGGNSQ